MLFTEARFLVFFGLVLAVHWSMRGARARKAFLLAASYAFYASFDARFLTLILVSTAVDYGCGRAMSRHPDRAGRRPFLVVSVAVNLALLGTFKYFGFFVRSAVELSRWLGLGASAPSLSILLPVGISFYTFQTLSYSVDVYRGRLAASRSPLDFALFVAFFPQLVAGPIVRATELLPQLAQPRRFRQHVPVRASLTLFLVGFVKKACAADGIAAIVDPLFADPAGYGRAASWVGLCLYHVQIYCDFSGYSDMAIATAGLLGYRLPLNFDFPYFSRSVSEFWRRWHISLATWMRDYVFFSVVGRAPSAARRLWSVFLTMTVCGLWHGAGWNFVSFGALHGAFLVVEDVWNRTPLRAAWSRGWTALLARPMTNLIVLLAWPVFRVGDAGDTGALYGNLFGLRAPGAETIGGLATAFLAGFAVVHWIGHRAFLRGRLAALPPWAFAIVYGLAWSLVLPWVADDTVPFIYFQF